MPVMGDGGPAGHDFGVAPHQILRMLLFVQLHIVRVTIQMVEILQQGKIQGVFQTLVGDVLGQICRQIHRKLLITDGVGQDALLPGLQVAHGLLLLLFAATQQGQHPAQIVIHAVPEKLMGKPHVFKFRAVHQNDPGAGIGIGLPEIVGLGPEMLPIVIEFRTLCRQIFKWIHKKPRSFRHIVPEKARLYAQNSFYCNSALAAK